MLKETHTQISVNLGRMWSFKFSEHIMTTFEMWLRVKLWNINNTTTAIHCLYWQEYSCCLTQCTEGPTGRDFLKFIYAWLLVSLYPYSKYILSLLYDSLSIEITPLNAHSSSVGLHNRVVESSVCSEHMSPHIGLPTPTLATTMPLCLPITHVITTWCVWQTWCTMYVCCAQSIPVMTFLDPTHHHAPVCPH